MLSFTPPNGPTTFRNPSPRPRQRVLLAFGNLLCPPQKPTSTSPWLHWVPEGPISLDFRQCLTEATRRVEESLFLPVKEALSRHGFRILVAQLASHVLKTPEDYFDPDSLADWQQEQRRSPSVKTLWRFPAFLRHHKERQILARAFQQEIRDYWDREGTPQYLRGQRAVLIQEKKRDPQAPHQLQDAQIPGKDYATIIRHELGHFVDFVLGPLALGHRFSQDRRFRALLKRELDQQAKEYPFPPARTPGKQRVEFAYAFPLYSDHPRRFQEAFTEIFSALQGGGYLLTPAMAYRHFPQTCRYLEERFQEPLP